MCQFRLSLFLFSFLTFASFSSALEISSGYTMSIALAKDAFHVGEPIHGEIIITSTKSGFPVTFNVIIEHEGERRFTKHVHFPQLFMGRDVYPLETFGITTFDEAGRWRIEISSPGLEPQVIVELEVINDAKVEID